MSESIAAGVCIILALLLLSGCRYECTVSKKPRCIKEPLQCFTLEKEAVGDQTLEPAVMNCDEGDICRRKSFRMVKQSESIVVICVDSYLSKDGGVSFKNTTQQENFCFSENHN
jgi:hypothetical protein